jgi:hypothetical protein
MFEQVLESLNTQQTCALLVAVHVNQISL